MARICFVSNEIYPTTPGGAGALVYHLAQRLLDEDHEIIFLLDLSRAAFQRFNTVDRLALPNNSKCRAYHVNSLCEHIPYREDDFSSRYLWESYRYDFAGRQIYEQEKPELIEFLDYCGPAYFPLCAKIAGLSYQNAHISIRIHGSVEIIDRHTGTVSLNFDRYMIYALERFSLRLAESVLYPTPSSLQEYVQAGHAPWFGQSMLSQPVMTMQLHRESEEPGANIVLFYGRLSSVKGVDQFVEAAVLYLSDNPDPSLEFYLVGHDSMDPPVKEPISYQDYLSRKMPERFKKRFVFTGFLNEVQFTKLLPRVKFAVFPSHYESFCLAAHELRRAGIPLILSPIPAFKDHFSAGVDALFFDGSVSDLVKQIKLLDRDHAIRASLSKPYISEDADSFSIYRSIPISSWIESFQKNEQNEILICIIDNDGKDDLIGQTLNSLKNFTLEDGKILILRKCIDPENRENAYWLFGSWYEFSDPDGNQVVPIRIRAMNCLLILRAGDQVAWPFIAQAMGILERQPQIAYVTGWKWIGQESRKWLYTHPLAAMIELAPLEAISVFNRCVMRTPEGALLIDLFEQTNKNLSEVGYLWQLDNDQTCGIQLPEPYIWQGAESFSPTEFERLSSLILGNQSPGRLIHLARYLTLLVNANPGALLPLQTDWARRSGLPVSDKKISNSSIISRQNWRSKLSKRLANGGIFSQYLLMVLRRIKKLF